MNPHERPEQLSEYLDGRLTAEETREIQAHLESCAACRADLSSIRETRDILACLRMEPAVPANLDEKILGRIRVAAPSRRFNPHLWAMAAMVCLTAVVLFRLRDESHIPLSPSETVPTADVLPVESLPPAERHQPLPPLRGKLEGGGSSAASIQGTPLPPSPSRGEDETVRETPAPEIAEAVPARSEEKSVWEATEPADVSVEGQEDRVEAAGILPMEKTVPSAPAKPTPKKMATRRTAMKAKGVYMDRLSQTESPEVAASAPPPAGPQTPQEKKEAPASAGYALFAGTSSDLDTPAEAAKDPMFVAYTRTNGTPTPAAAPAPSLLATPARVVLRVADPPAFRAALDTAVRELGARMEITGAGEWTVHHPDPQDILTRLAPIFQRMTAETGVRIEIRFRTNTGIPRRNEE
ncbi:zf-HC2 domain-containing protein [bacterium]|nr:zf-HC2 domain-containing protein [bacterium]